MTGGVCEGFAITGNTVQDNYLGTYLYTRSSNNTLYHNNFINNTGGNAYDEGIYNQWDSGSAGNYWSDYACNDTDGDGIGDDPYHIQGYAGSVDRYPLMHSWNTTSQRGDLNGDNQITPAQMPQSRSNSQPAAAGTLMRAAAATVASPRSMRS